MSDKKPVIGITCGDLNGIGLEVVIKSLVNPAILDMCTPVVFAQSKVASYHRKALNIRDFSFNIVDDLSKINLKKANLVNCWKDNVNIQMGQPDVEVGAFAKKSLDAGIDALKNEQIDALVTAPLNKSTVVVEGEEFTGHTGYLGKAFEASPTMILTSEDLRVALVTEHIPISEVSKALTTERIVNKTLDVISCLKVDFNISKPKIAVLGLNPHASDSGLMGTEEAEIIQPAIDQLIEAGHVVKGPFASDGFFGTGVYDQYDAVMAMYHDQGLIPFKTLHFNDGVNYTAGLPVIRTSPDHGTGYDIAGKNQADAQSLRESIYLAIESFRKRSLYKDLTSNPLKNQKRHRPDR